LKLAKLSILNGVSDRPDRHSRSAPETEGGFLKSLFSTGQVHARDRFDFWHAVACINIADHDSRPACRQTFHAEIQSGVLADVGIVAFENSSMDVWHTTQHAERMKGDELFICRHVAGTLALGQNSREVVLEAGDITLLDPRSPYVGKFSSGSKLLVLKVPRRDLEARVGNLREITCRPIRVLQPANGLLSSFLAMLPVHAEALGVATQGIVRDQALDLFAASCAQAMEGHKPRGSARSLVGLNVRAAIDARLADPTLDSATVAGAAGVSVRYANAVLAQDDTSIMRLIQAKRLARCRMALEDLSQAHRMISEIAYGWGFTDMTHFGRRFKAAYGFLPSDCRRGVKQFRQLTRQSDPTS
jgi:AraC family transcriptional activator of tynA and feaB